MADLEKKRQEHPSDESVHTAPGGKHDVHSANEFDVYGDESSADIQYRTLVWWKAAALMLAETVSLGSLGAIATATGYVLGQFKLRYPHVHNMADAGEIIAGPIGREVLGAAQVIFMIFVCGSHVLTGLIAFDTITNGASCSVLWAGISAIICLAFTIPRTLDGIAYLSVASFVSIIAAILITMIGVGVVGHQGAVVVTSHLNFANGFLAVTDIVRNFPFRVNPCIDSDIIIQIFAYAGHVAFFTFIAEMKKPEDFAKALYALQIADTTLYLIVGIVVYAYTGSNAVSPALGNTGHTLRRVAYGVALPTIMIAGVINGHVCAKLMFVRIFRRNGVHSRHMTSHTWSGWLTWIGLCFVIWTLAFIIAEVIPFFNDLLGVISSLFASWFTYGISGIFYFHLTPKPQRWSTPMQKAKTIFFSCIIVMGAFIMIAGLYSSITSIVNGYKDGSFPSPFSCVNRALA
ncbi:hypothetical protein EW026_g3292 [Hermanssonia centrifuga]|uniref:Amino acid transporter transmembrane domain-containing protein n=1 Tax=Hermanssonia centrifuga TaxID=98765 RepID=A0A4S4KL55_9APHY|nr:hypothetical protein EW026_g3292 [Hermanssonia centrifuga]